MEAHGGYSFCGLAALMFLNKGHLCNIDTLLKWAANRQMRVEGGFQVSTNSRLLNNSIGTNNNLSKKIIVFIFLCRLID